MAMAAAVLALAGTAVATAPTASAGASGPAAPPRPLLGREQQVRAYWTRSRMEHAIQLGPLGAPLGSTRTPRAASTTSAARESGAGGIRTPRTVGKLFFSDAQNDYVCSASAIRTRSRDQVLTAGHCVHTGPNPDDLGIPLLDSLLSRPHYFSDWMFVPRYYRGRAPLGKWVATNRYVSSGWTQHENFSQDQAILTMGRRKGKRLVDVTGGDRLALGKGPNQGHVRIWGWPAESPYNGRVALRCDARTTETNVDWPGDARMSCPLNGGASGGPWLLRGRRTANTGTIFAVTSREAASGTKELLAQPLPRELRTLIRRAGG